MDKERSKNQKPLSGIGEILRKGEHFANCTYQIQMLQEISISESFNDMQEIPGRNIISGIVIISQQEIVKPGIWQGLNSGESFTLLLSDRRSLKTSFNPIGDNNNPINGKYRILPLPQA